MTKNNYSRNIGSSTEEMRIEKDLMHDEVYTGSQDVGYRAVYRVNGKKVRIHIRVDSYKFQSYAIAEVFSVALDKWEPLTSLHYSNMQSVRDLNKGTHRWEIKNQYRDVETLLASSRGILDSVS